MFRQSYSSVVFTVEKASFGIRASHRNAVNFQCQNVSDITGSATAFGDVHQPAAFQRNAASCTDIPENGPQSAADWRVVSVVTSPAACVRGARPDIQLIKPQPFDGRQLAAD